MRPRLIRILSPRFLATAMLGFAIAGFRCDDATSSDPAVKLVIITQPPASVAAGADIVIEVAQHTASGEIATSPPTGIELSLQNPPGANTAFLTGTTGMSLVDGVARFTVATTTLGIGYTIVATPMCCGLTPATTTPFSVVPGPPTSMEVIGVPSTVQALSTISPVQVRLRDRFGYLATNATTNVTLAIAIGSGTAGAVLGGTLTKAAAIGGAVFDDLTIDKAGSSYVLTATAPSVTSASSGILTVTQAPATKLAFVAQPANVTAGTPLGALQIVVQDAAGNPVSGNRDITLAIASGTGASGATLGGTLTKSTGSDTLARATFDNISINKPGAGYALVATATGLTSATSTAFDVTVGAPANLSFSSLPGTVAAGAVLSPAVQVVVRDAAGNTVPTATNTIAIAIASGTGATGAVLSGTLTAAALNGVATFNDLTVDKIATGYRLVATTTGLTAGTSATFNVTVGPPVKLTFTSQPKTGEAVGSGFSNGLKVAITDAGGNVISSASGAITLALGTNPTAASLSGTTTVNTVSGVATFTGVAIDKAGQGYTLTATSPDLTSATSAPFSAYGAAAKLAFKTQPASGVRNSRMEPAITVEVQDAVGNVVTSASNAVTIAFGANAAGANIIGTATRSASSGVATFDDLSVSATGTGYTFTAAASGLTSATSAAFDMAAFGAAAKLAFVTQPSTSDAGAVINPAVQVAVRDIHDNPVTTSTAPITIALAANPGSATLGGTLAADAVAGIATFSDLTVSAAGTGYTLTGSSASLTSATSSAFNIVNPGGALKLGFLDQPTGTTAGSTIVPAVTVAIQNSSGATVTSDNSTVVSITVASGPAGGTVGGTLSATAVNGVATFSALQDTIAGEYTLRASATGLISGTSSSYTIIAGVATKLRFLTQLANTVAGQPFAPTVQVAVTDNFGNTVPSATNSITLSDDTFYWINQSLKYNLIKGGEKSLAGTLTVAAVNGVASFPDLRPRWTEIDNLLATAPGLTSIYSAGLISVTPSVPTRIWALPPVGDCGVLWCGATQTANVSFVVSAYVLDSLSNQVNAGSNIVSLSIGANPGSATLSAPSNITATNGRADFTVTVNKGGNGYTLLATTAGLSSLASYPFNVASFGPASRLGFSVQPTNADAGASITPGVQVCVEDGVGNRVTNATNSITIAIGANPGSATLNGTKTVAAVSGCATFNNLSLSAAGTGYTLTATASGLTSATSNSFNVAPGSPTLTVNFCGPTSPVWAAYQDDAGAWTQATITNKSFTATIASSRGAIAYTEQRGTKYRTVIAYATKSELAAMPCIPLIADFFAGTKTFHGTLAGIGGMSTRVNHFPAGIDITTDGNTGTFTIPNSLDGPHDLFALRYNGDAAGSLTDKMVVRRGLNPAQGSTIPVIDFGTAEAVTPASATYTISNIGSGGYALDVSTLTGASGTITISTANGGSQGLGGVPITYQGWPATLQTAGDYHQLFMEAGPKRGLIHTFATVTNRSITLGPVLSTPTITTLSNSPNLRLRAQVASQIAYPNLFNLQTWQQGAGGIQNCSICNAERAFDISASAAYFGGTPPTWDISMPDMATAGYQSTYGLVPGTPSQWYVSAHSTYGINQMLNFIVPVDETPNLFAWQDISPAILSRPMSAPPALQQLRLIRPRRPFGR